VRRRPCALLRTLTAGARYLTEPPALLTRLRVAAAGARAVSPSRLACAARAAQLVGAAREKYGLPAAKAVPPPSPPSLPSLPSSPSSPPLPPPGMPLARDGREPRDGGAGPPALGADADAAAAANALALACVQAVPAATNAARRFWEPNVHLCYRLQGS
jgi:hypothetical protein